MVEEKCEEIDENEGKKRAEMNENEREMAGNR